MLSQLISKTVANFAKPTKVKSLRQRMKFYARFPEKFKLKTLIRPPDLTQDKISFPIRIPIRYRHIFKLKRDKFVPDSRTIHWRHLEPNQVLLGFENLQYLDFKELVEGLRVLSEIKGQQKHDWNKHEWVSKALAYINQNFDRIKKKDTMNFYFLMKKLNFTDEGFWKKMYGRIEENLYDLTPNNFEYIYLTYYDLTDKLFSAEAKKKFGKLMEGRIRQFSPAGIIKVFQQFIRDKQVDNYWLENVFVSLFKQQQYHYNARQIGEIFRSMMILGHEENERLYDNLYTRIRKLQFKREQQIELLQEVLMEVKEIFVSHRVDSTLEFLEQRKNELKELNKQEKKKTIEEMVRNDLKYFLEKRKLKQQTKGAQLG